MKPGTKNRMKRLGAAFFSLLLLCALLLSSVSCEEKPDLTDEAEVYTSSVIGSREAFAYGEYIYQLINGACYRYNRVSGVRVSACFDPECEGDCLLHSAFALHGLHRERLFFTARGETERVTSEGVEKENVVHYAYQELHTGEITVLRTCSKYERVSDSLYFSGDYIYYRVALLKEGGVPENADDYEPTVCRMPIDGGAEERFYVCSSYSESVICVLGEKLITMRDGVLYSCDPAKDEARELFDHEKFGYAVKPLYTSVLGNRLYFIGKTAEPIPNPYGPIYRQYLCMLDLETGEYTRLVEDPVMMFCLTDDALYYWKIDVHTVYEAKNEDEKGLYNPHSAEFYACDLDGGNERVVYTNGTLKPIKDLFVIDGALFGWFFLYDEETETYLQGMRYRKIDLRTGEFFEPVVE